MLPYLGVHTLFCLSAGASVVYYKEAPAQAAALGVKIETKTIKHNSDVFDQDVRREWPGVKAIAIIALDYGDEFSTLTSKITTYVSSQILAS